METFYVIGFLLPDGSRGLIAWPPDGHLCGCQHMEHVAKHYIRMLLEPTAVVINAEAKPCILAIKDYTQLQQLDGTASQHLVLSNGHYILYYPILDSVEYEVLMDMEEASGLALDTLKEHIADKVLPHN